MKTVISVTNPNAWPERNQAKFLFKKFIESEYQFEMSNGLSKVLVVFRKGLWGLVYPGDLVVEVGDGGHVERASDPVLGALVRTIYNFDDLQADYNENSGDIFGRSPQARALWRLTEALVPDFVTASHVTFTIELPGRNGYLSENNTVITDRKDW